MARKASTTAEPIGTKKEREKFTEVHTHYIMAKEDLESRYSDWDTKDELFRSYVEETGWPYNSVVFDPRIFTAIFEKTSRLFANKPRGRLVPREGGDALGAKINNELLKFQWDDASRTMEQPMIARWAQMDMNARKYGASFALVKWNYTRKKEKDEDGKLKSVPWFDGPNFKPLINRDCLPNPSYSYIKNWFQVREYPTFQELENTNDAARSKPVYKNLDLLKQRMKEQESTKGGDRRDTHWESRNKTIKGLTDYLGQDEVFKNIEVVTEYRDDRWVTIAPRHGVVLRDIENPYEHGQIPIVMLKYYPIDDDLYGLSEIEPVERLQKAVNALVNQYLDAINMSLYTPLKIKAHAVQMHTLEFGPGKKWIMNEPGSDVIPHESSTAGVQEFVNTYSFMISAMQSALGETSQGISNLSPFDNEKTATEVRDMAAQRNARDNFNQIFLAEALKKQMMFWCKMNKQFLFSDPREKQKIIRVVGKDAIRYFQQRGLDGYGLTDEAAEQVRQATDEGLPIRPEDLETPLYPIGTEDGETIPKFMVEEGGEMGMMVLEKEDLSGTYDYIPDVESMELPDNQQKLAAKREVMGFVMKPEVMAAMQQEGYQFKLKEFLEDFIEDTGMTDGDKYFEKGSMNDQSLIPGEGSLGAGQVPGGNGIEQGLADIGALAPNQAQPSLPGPGTV